jgi:hypothetical protein
LSLAVIQHFFLPSRLHLYAGYFVMKCRRAASIHELPRASIPGNRTFSINHYQKLPVLLVARKDHTIVVGRELHNTLQAEPDRFHSDPGLFKGHTHLGGRTTGLVQHWRLFSL